MLNAILAIGSLGLVFGLVLAYAAKRFHVDIDERTKSILDILPGVNCGACGFAGCSAFADAVVQDKAPVNGCVPGGSAVAETISVIVEKEVLATQARKYAVCLCQGGASVAGSKSIYDGLPDCRALNVLNGGNKKCPVGCLGEGTCAFVCPYDAITMSSDNLPLVDRDKCTGCGICVEACPRHLMKLSLEDEHYIVLCVNKQKGIEAKKGCSMTCLKCKRCERACENDAVHVVTGVALIDSCKCINCGKCEEQCPNKVIRKF